MKTKPILLIDADLAQALVNYLQERPFREVAGLISALMKLQAVPEQPKANGVPQTESPESGGGQLAS